MGNLEQKTLSAAMEHLPSMDGIMSPAFLPILSILRFVAWESQVEKDLHLDAEITRGRRSVSM